ncbi:MAG: TolC family protein, partial [Candidatus Binatia bacterium]
EVDVELMQEFPWPGTLGARTAVARAARAGAQAEVWVTRRDVSTAMAMAYYRLRYAATALAILLEQRRLLDAAVQISRTRYATGAAPQVDPLQAKLAQDRLESEAFALQGEHAAAAAAVNALRGRPATDSLPVPLLRPEAVRARIAPLPTVDSLVAEAAARHPRLAARRAQVEQATQAIRVERLGARPDFSLSFRYGYRPVIMGTNLPDFFSVFLGVRVPIWAGRKQHRLADAARADSSASASALEDEQLRLGRDVVETAARVEAARRRLVLLVDGILPTARATVESASRTYQVGQTEFLTLLAVQDALFRVETEAAAVAADYQMQLVMLRQLTAGESQP